MTQSKHHDGFRTRIAAAVARELVQQARDCGEYQTRDCYKVADAVIRELEADYILVPKSHTLARKAFKYGERYGI